MANARAGTVIFCDTSNTTYTGTMKICAVKYIGAASGTAEFKQGSSSGATLWRESGSTNIFNEVEMQINDGLNVTLTNSAAVYIYLAAD